MKNKKTKKIKPFAKEGGASTAQTAHTHTVRKHYNRTQTKHTQHNTTQTQHNTNTTHNTQQRPFNPLLPTKKNNTHTHNSPVFVATMCLRCPNLGITKSAICLSPYRLFFSFFLASERHRMNKDVLPGGSDQTVTRGTDGRKISRGTHKQILCGGGLGGLFFVIELSWQGRTEIQGRGRRFSN